MLKALMVFYFSLPEELHDDLLYYLFSLDKRTPIMCSSTFSKPVEGSVPRDSAAKQKKPEKPGKAAKNRTRSSVAEEHDRVSR